MEKKILYVGMDVHKKSIDVAITDKRTNGKVRSYGKIDGTLEALDKLIRKLKSKLTDRYGRRAAENNATWKMARQLPLPFKEWSLALMMSLTLSRAASWSTSTLISHYSKAPGN